MSILNMALLSIILTVAHMLSWRVALRNLLHNSPREFKAASQRKPREAPAFRSFSLEALLQKGRKFLVPGEVGSRPVPAVAEVQPRSCRDQCSTQSYCADYMAAIKGVLPWWWYESDEAADGLPTQCFSDCAATIIRPSRERSCRRSLWKSRSARWPIRHSTSSAEPATPPMLASRALQSSRGPC